MSADADSRAQEWAARAFGEKTSDEVAKAEPGSPAGILRTENVQGIPMRDLVCGVCGFAGMPVMEPFADSFALTHIQKYDGGAAHITIRA